MNILFIIHNLGTKVPESRSTLTEGGSEIFTYSIAHNMSKDHTCYILYPDLQQKGIKYLHKISFFRNEFVGEYKEENTFICADNFRSILKDFNIDLIHYQHIIYNSLEYAIIGNSLGIPQILSIHDYFYLCDEHFLENDKYVTCNVPHP